MSIKLLPWSGTPTQNINSTFRAKENREDCGICVTSVKIHIFGC